MLFDTDEIVVEDGDDDPGIIVFSADVDSYADISSFILPLICNSVQYLMIANACHLVHHQDTSLAFSACCNQLLDNDCVQTEVH